MTALEITPPAPRRALPIGTRVRFKFLGHLAEGEIVKRSPEYDNPDLTVLYTIEFGTEKWQTVQPSYAIIQIIETHEIIPPTVARKRPGGSGAGGDRKVGNS